MKFLFVYVIFFSYLCTRFGCITMRTTNIKDILRITTYFIDPIDENVDVEVVTVGNWLEYTHNEQYRNDGVYILRQMLDEKGMFLRGNRSDVLIDKIVASCNTIRSLLYAELSASIVELLVKICKVKHNNHIPDEVVGDLRQLATLIAGGYMMNDFLAGRENVQQNTIAEDVYAVLEITSSATDEEVMKAFRKLSLKYHPDRMVNASAQEKEWASSKLQAVVEARNIIMEYRKRQNS